SSALAHFCLPSFTNGIKTSKSFEIIQVESVKFCSHGINHPENENIIQLQDHRRSPGTQRRSQKWYKIAQKSLNLSRIRKRCKNREAERRRRVDKKRKISANYPPQG
ncbi:MAG: hypothetical protein II184_05720, partial [Clostridia bacterium]|nr:hypothetical protein [Clostridia bacterium]